MMRRTLAASVVGLCALAGTADAAAFFDGTFNAGDWSLVTISNANGIGSSTNGIFVAAGGNGGSYRLVADMLLASGSNAAVHGIHLNNTAFYNPFTQGAITSIDYSEDSINFIPDTVLPGNGQGTGLAIFQGGKYYELRNPTLVMPYASYSTWTQNSALGAVAADFWEIDGGGILNPFSNPDFSVAGAVMQFGFWRGNSGNGSYTTECGIDNWHVNIVPTPSVGAPLAIGMLLGVRRRRAARTA